MGRSAAAMRKRSARLRQLPSEGVTAAAATVRKAVIAQARADTGGDLRLSGLKRGQAFTVTVKKTGSNIVTAEMKAGPPRQRAPWFWLNEGTRPHGGHPGTPKKSTWDKPVDKVRPDIIKDMEARFKTAVK
jgi:hypothetical protein